VLALAVAAAVALPLGVSQAADPIAATPVEIAQAALARARPALACRFAFTLQEEGSAKSLFAQDPSAVKQTIEFDPRRAIGDRWKIIRNEKNVRREIRRQLNWGGRSDPRADMLTLTLEGDIDITELQLKEERPDAWVFSFTPFATSTVNQEAHVFLNALKGELWVSRANNQIVRRRLFIEEPFDTGLGRIRVADFDRVYVDNGSGYTVTQDTVQKMSITVQGRGVDSHGKQRISGVTPICDPAEVRAIAEMEARDVGYERSDGPTRTGTRIRPRGRLPGASTSK
jgi:hypothetical protein